MKKSLFFRQKGFTLIETVVGVGVVAIMTVVVVSYARIKTTDSQRAESNVIVKRAHSSLQSFILLNSKLPCPAPDVNGIASEDCHAYQGTISGYFPYRTVGLPDNRAGKISYSIDNGKDGSLSLTQVDEDSLKIMSVSSRKTIYQAPSDIAESKGLNSSSDGFINFCAALVSAPETQTLPAYTLVFKDNNFGLSVFDDPLITTRSDLFQKYHCASLISGAARTHANTSLAVHMMSMAAQDVSDYAKIRLERQVLDLKERLYFAGLKYTLELVGLLTAKESNEADKGSKATSKPAAAPLDPIKDFFAHLQIVQNWLGIANDLITIPRQIFAVAESLMMYSQSLTVLQDTRVAKHTTDLNLFNNIFLGLELPTGSYTTISPLQAGLSLSYSALASQKYADKVMTEMNELISELKTAVNADQRDDAKIAKLQSAINDKAQQLEKLVKPLQVDEVAGTEYDSENDPAIKELRNKLTVEKLKLQDLYNMPLPEGKDAALAHAEKIDNQAKVVADLESNLADKYYEFLGLPASEASKPYTPNDAEKAFRLAELKSDYVRLTTEYANILSLVPTSGLTQAQINKMAAQKEAEISVVNSKIEELKKESSYS